MQKMANDQRPKIKGQRGTRTGQASKANGQRPKTKDEIRRAGGRRHTAKGQRPTATTMKATAKTSATAEGKPKAGPTPSTKLAVKLKGHPKLN